MKTIVYTYTVSVTSPLDEEKRSKAMTKLNEFWLGCPNVNVFEDGKYVEDPTLTGHQNMENLKEAHRLLCMSQANEMEIVVFSDGSREIRPMTKPRKRLITVLHDPLTKDPGNKILRACETSIDGGADGILLCMSGIPSDSLATIIKDIRKDLVDAPPWFFIGVNSLSLSALDAVTWGSVNNIPIWTDTIFEHDFSPSVPPGFKCGIQWFGGVEFKYQNPHPSGIEGAVKAAMSIPCIITTSGSGTGSAPGLQKIVEFRSAIGPEPELAVASGVDVDNVELLLPFVDVFIVRSSLETDRKLDVDKVRQLSDIIHKYSSD